ncbi:inner membrane protein YbjM [Sodalis-like endosymbiont of Proechinophthirus fluctus]|uniref:inner membrane protein YbjM n=1 Tax=Sodalis-like endosymbiont of Proechinophthirus fluctus TaxID=1462730 RepID=UPI00082C4CF7|nr:inner membrane protein YbjM [Sodalis-like endosymbiont of Proechinophthirus fluctus]
MQESRGQLADFLLIFISQKTALVSFGCKAGQGGKFDLLLFMLHSILGALLSGNNNPFYPPLGALLAAAVYCLLFNIGVTTHDRLQAMALTNLSLLSAVFWCVFGAFGCCFAGMFNALSSALKCCGQLQRGGDIPLGQITICRAVDVVRAGTG